jgi:hypothetical protein
VKYQKQGGVLTLTNLASRQRTFRVEGVDQNVCLGPGESWTSPIPS